MKKILREVPFWVIIILPIIYLNNVWEDLPAEVPLHFNIQGEADRWGTRSEFLWVIILVPAIAYLILLAAKYIDPKQQISKMGRKFYQIRLIMTVMLSALFLLLINSITTDNGYFPSSLFIIIGLLFIFLGNYFRNIKPNYFIGLRTPWALENEQVWRETHQHTSIVWFIGGILMALFNIWQPIDRAWPFNLTILLFMIIIPILYSYYRYVQLKKIDP